MYSSMLRLVGSLEVIERDGFVTIRGINTRQFALDIKRKWKTTRIVKNLFSVFKSSEVKLPSFFALELYYMISALEVDPKARMAKRVYVTLQDELLKNTWLANTQKKEIKSFLDRSQLKRLNVTLFKEQEGLLDFYERTTQQYNLNGGFLFGEAGIGKTETSLGWALTTKADTIIVICPNPALEDVWEKRIKQRFKKVPKHFIANKPNKQPDGGEEIIVYPMQSIGKLLDWVRFHGRHLGSVSIILDESHKLNEITAARTLHFIELCKKVNLKGLLWMSGTPFKAQGSETIPLFRTICPDFTPDVEQRLLKIFGKDVSRAGDILSHRLGQVLFKIEKKDAVDVELIELTQKVVLKDGLKYTLNSIREEMRVFIGERMSYYQDNYQSFLDVFNKAIEIYKESINVLHVKSNVKQNQLQQYLSYVDMFKRGFDSSNPVHLEGSKYCKKFEKDEIIPSLPKELRNPFKDVVTVVKYMDLKVRGEVLGKIVGGARLDCSLAMVKHSNLDKWINESEKRTLIFSNRVDVVESIYEYCKSLGYNPITIHGSNGRTTKESMDIVNGDYSVNPLITTYDTLTEAVEVQIASTVILFDKPFRDYIKNQAVSRAWRRGQDKDVKVVSVELDTDGIPNISTRTADIMEWSKENVDLLMGKENKVELKELVNGFTEEDSFSKLIPISVKKWFKGN